MLRNLKRFTQSKAPIIQYKQKAMHPKKDLDHFLYQRFINFARRISNYETMADNIDHAIDLVISLTKSNLDVTTLRKIDGLETGINPVYPNTIAEGDELMQMMLDLHKDENEYRKWLKEVVFKA